jgi:hypothetical protein
MRKVHSDDDPWVHAKFDLCWKDEPEDRTFGGELAFPSWVPEPVIQMAVSMWKIDAERRPRSCVDENTAAQEAILRLARDSRMREVWDELRKKHHHVDATVAWSHWHKMLGETASLVDRTPEEIGLALFFHRAAFLAIEDIRRRDEATNPDPSEADLHRLAAGYLDLAGGGPVSEQWALILGNVSRFFANFDLQTDDLQIITPAIQRDHGNRRVRIFANLLANVTNRLFGQALHGTVANTVNVALDLKGKQQITRKNVKNWWLRDWAHTRPVTGVEHVRRVFGHAP